MPPKSRSQRGGEKTSTGLIIALVFFILATIGLGVGTYYGFAEQAAKDKAVAEAKREVDSMKKALAYSRFVNYTLSDYIGERDGIDQQDYATLRSEWDGGKLGAGEKDLESTRKKIGKLDGGEPGWDAGKRQAKATYQQLLAQSRAEYNNLLNAMEQEKEKVREAVRKKEEAEKLVKDAEVEYKENLNKVKTNATKDLAKETTDIRAIQAKVVELSEANETIRKKADDDVKRAQVEVKKRDAQIVSLRAARDQLQVELAQYKEAKSDAPVTARTDWRIVRMDQRGTRPYINLGSADRVRPQLTFSIHSLGLDGKMVPEPKGTLEVTTVLGDHMSQTRITGVKDPNRNPILEGDVLYNPLWNPTLKKHVAIAGLIDLSGISRDPELGLADFLRHLEKENVIVDAYVDPKPPFGIKVPDGAKGVNLQTDFLILGESSDFFTDGRERSVDIAKRIETSIQEMKRQAKENGVAVISLRKYLESVGYRVPPHLAGTSEVSPLYKERIDQALPTPPDRQPIRDINPDAPGKK
jgi:hypothetical protein